MLRILLTHRSSKYTRPLQEAQIEIMRVLANLCIECDTNRDKLLHLQAASAILALVDSLLNDPIPDMKAMVHFDTQTLALLRAATGAILNLQLDHPATKRALGASATSLRTIYRLASTPRIYVPNSWADGNHGFARAAHGSPKQAENMNLIRTGATVSTWAWRIVQDVVSCGATGVSDGGALSPSSGTELSGRSRSDTLLTDAAINATAVSLRAFLAASSHHKQGDDILPWDAEDVSTLIESDMEVLSAAAELIESTSLDSPAFRLLSVSPEHWPNPASQPAGLRHRNPLELYTAFFERAAPPPAWQGTSRTPVPADTQSLQEAEKQYAQCKAAVARSIVAIAGEDRCMDVLFGSEASGLSGASWFIDTLKSWASMRRGTNRDDLVSIALLTLGNLARKDSHCVAMIEQHDVGTLLAPVLADEQVDVKVAHGLVGLLKNLAIPAQNKERIGSLGVIEAVGRFLEPSKDMVQPLQFGTVGLLKHLCTGSIANAVRLANGPVLHALLAVNRRTDDVPTRMESTRVLFNIVKTLWSVRDADSGSTTTVAAAVAAAKAAIMRFETAEALCEMVRNGVKYPILVNEGVIALTLLATDARGSLLVTQALVQQKPAQDEDNDTANNSSSNGNVKGSSSSATNPHDNDKERRLPQREGTADNTASLPPASASDALGMLENVLTRRDARMPPQYAANACSLLIAIFEASKGAGTGAGAIGSRGGATAAALAAGGGARAKGIVAGEEMDISVDLAAAADAHPITAIARRMSDTLRGLQERGPAEMVAMAERALQLSSQCSS
ncbi:hypothetical protein K437DRAFT_94222 [Tilletiaria anomala UBC 951]|uniref:ARM repeat-containing protein n=1 Tax=Tilletiaria anomala (strain ATCC 24038 / CBS 436.72 / UBC 951) TaxID=1037660 RepID=A0A066W4T8_TILAU|nr:uncharacterized protein K437DRAFT_94222 [Tilletiaria anomala UBC 951]KDN47568.1 hypothetical protein K437DRAFT_94222 [Tilletiaria anomala UBC 951]